MHGKKTLLFKGIIKVAKHILFIKLSWMTHFGELSKRTMMGQYFSLFHYPLCLSW